MPDEPQGLNCPGCGEPAYITLAGQAFCGNGNCRVVSWNPGMTLEELADNMQHLDLSKLFPREDES